jgi:hypothetical protein
MVRLCKIISLVSWSLLSTDSAVYNSLNLIVTISPLTFAELETAWSTSGGTFGSVPILISNLFQSGSFWALNRYPCINFLLSPLFDYAKALWKRIKAIWRLIIAQLQQHTGPSDGF